MDRLAYLWLMPFGLTLSPSSAGERLSVEGYAQSTEQGILIGLSRSSSRVLSVPSVPTDRAFLPPGWVRWELELTGSISKDGQPVAKALGSSPKAFVWPAGEEFSPVKFAGKSNSLNPFEDPLDPLGVRTGSPPDYDEDGVEDEVDAFPDDPEEFVDTDSDGSGNHADEDDDDDGIPDAWEITYGLNPSLPDANGDVDRDGSSNFAEYEAGTGANNGSSLFQVKTISEAAPGVLRLEWHAVPGRSYSLWRSPSLSLAPELVEDGIEVLTTEFIHRDVSMGSTRDFYFIKVSLSPNP